jgi:hypothetical protein
VNSTSASFTAQTLDSARERYAALSRAHTRTRSTRFHTHCSQAILHPDNTRKTQDDTLLLSSALFAGTLALNGAHTHFLALTRARSTNARQTPFMLLLAAALLSLLLAGSLSLSLSCMLSGNARKTQDNALLLSCSYACSLYARYLSFHAHTPHSDASVHTTTTRTRYIQHANAFANKALCARIRSLDIQVSSSRLVSMSVVTDSACKCSSVTQISNSNPIVSQHIVTRLLAIVKQGLSVMGYGPR